MAKKRVSIYINEEIWDRIKEDAWKDRVSASFFLEQLVLGERDVYGKTVFNEVAVAAMIDSKLEVVEKIKESQITDAEIEMLRRVQDKADMQARKRTEIKGAIKTASDLPSQFKMNPQPKAKWKGAK